MKIKYGTFISIRNQCPLGEEIYLDQFAWYSCMYGSGIPFELSIYIFIYEEITLHGRHSVPFSFEKQHKCIRAYCISEVIHYLLQRLTVHVKSFHINDDGSVNKQLPLPWTTSSSAVTSSGGGVHSGGDIGGGGGGGQNQSDDELTCPFCLTRFLTADDRDFHRMKKCGPKQRVSTMTVSYYSRV